MIYNAHNVKQNDWIWGASCLLRSPRVIESGMARLPISNYGPSSYRFPDSLYSNIAWKTQIFITPLFNAPDEVLSEFCNADLAE